MAMMRQELLKRDLELAVAQTIRRDSLTSAVFVNESVKINCSALFVSISKAGKGSGGEADETAARRVCVEVEDSGCRQASDSVVTERSMEPERKITMQHDVICVPGEGKSSDRGNGDVMAVGGVGQRRRPLTVRYNRREDVLEVGLIGLIEAVEVIVAVIV